MMQQKEIFKKIGTIVNEIYGQYQYLSENPDQLNDLELELLSANSDFLAEHVKVLRKVAQGIASTQVVTKQEVKHSSEPVSPPATDEAVKPALTEPATEIKNIKIEEPESRPLEEVRPEEQKAIDVTPQPEFQPHANVASLPEPVAEKEHVDTEASQSEAQEHAVNGLSSSQAVVEEVKVAAEPVVREVVIPEKVTSVETSSVSPPAVQTLNDIISAQKAAQSNAFEPSKQPISDLKTAINLNDKLLFIKDLFNGYSLAYSEAIDILNRFDSFSVAETFLKTNYATKNNWAGKSSTVEKFYEILNRRYLR